MKKFLIIAKGKVKESPNKAKTIVSCRVREIAYLACPFFLDLYVDNADDIEAVELIDPEKKGRYASADNVANPAKSIICNVEFTPKTVMTQSGNVIGWKTENFIIGNKTKREIAREHKDPVNVQKAVVKFIERINTLEASNSNLKSENKKYIVSTKKLNKTIEDKDEEIARLNQKIAQISKHGTDTSDEFERGRQSVLIQLGLAEE